MTKYTTNFGVWGDLKESGYGYGWWLGKVNGSQSFFALGHGGQYILVFPELDMIVVITSDPDVDWDQADLQERTALNIAADYIIPAVLQRRPD